MALIIYGTKVFRKMVGYYGERLECGNCHRVYQRSYVKSSRWVHIDYIPLFPVKSTYLKICPVCGSGVELNKKDAKLEMNNLNLVSNQAFEVYAKHILAKKPKGAFAVDNSYELWVKDLVTGEDICIAVDITKDMVKNVKKNRGLKKLEIRDI